MSPNDSTNNKRLAQNTIFLYVRMVLLMLVSLYTSRITLQILGVEDFGIYNLVSGVVVMIAFLSNALNASCSRFLSIAVGSNDTQKIQAYFSSSLWIHIVFCVLLFLVFELAGFWFIRYGISIPEGRESATLWVYQFAIISTISSIIRTPFNASVIANERMGFFAWSSIAEGLLKLVAAFLITVVAFDGLIVFALLTAVANIAITLIYVVYAQCKLDGNKLLLKCNPTHIRQMLSFGFWNVFVGAADVGWQQGTNIILNLFHGVSLNATMGITNQVRTALYSLVCNLQTAANPQIIKSYSQNRKARYHNLFFSISKYSFLLIFLFAAPLLFNIHYIIELWLGPDNIPVYTSDFVALIILFSLMDNLIGPLWTINQAHGDIRSYSIIVSIILLLNLPATYALFYVGMPPTSMLVARILILLISLTFQLYYTQHKTDIRIMDYIARVVVPILIVCFMSSLPTYLICRHTEGGIRFVLSVVIFIPTFLASVLFLGMKKHDRIVLFTYIKNRLVR